MELLDRVAVVTGAARGIGRATAEAMAAAGAKVVVLDKDESVAAETATEIAAATGRSALPVACDVTIKDEVDAAFARALDACGRIDILVNNAGVWGHGKLSAVPEGEWDRIMDVNLKGVLFCTQAVSPIMQRQGSGKIVTIASAAGLGPSSDWSAYCISKAAVIMLTLVAATELEPFGIQANVLCPGATITDLTRDITAQTGSEFPHAVPPSRVAAAVLKLVAPFDQTTTGAVVREL